jgi:hypothetical protein
MWMTRRKSTADPWELPVNLGPDMNTSSFDSAPRISPDGSVLYFTSSRPENVVFYQNSDIYQSPIIPIVDLNGDGSIASADMCIMVDHWGENYPRCDIGPMAWGDGVVDVEDIKVLAEHLFTHPGAVAYWTLDETEGDIAYDSAGIHDGTLMGNAAWQPDGGQTGGALRFDGLDDYVMTEYVVNPAAGAFSVFAWINGGMAGQVIIAQQANADWLSFDDDGRLMTDIKCEGRSAGPLLSEAAIADGQWHRIGLTWDGSSRTLSVDDVAVAEDTQTDLASSDQGQRWCMNQFLS